MEVVASLSKGRTAAAHCGLFIYKSVPVIFEPPCIYGVTERKLSSMDNIRQNLLVLDRQASNCEECQLLEFAKNDNTVILYAYLHPQSSKY